MSPERLREDLAALRERVAEQHKVVYGLVLATIALSLGLFKAIGTERTIVAPPVIDKSFWVSASRVSAAYLEQMGSYSAHLILDVSPESIDWKRDVLLQYATPEAAAQLKLRQSLEADRLKKMNATTFFAAQQIFPSEQSMSVVLKGRLMTLINGARVDSGGEGRAYIAGFRYSGSRIQLNAFKEVPYDTPATDQAALLADAGLPRRD